MGTKKKTVELKVKEIRPHTRKNYSAEEKIKIETIKERRKNKQNVTLFA